MELKAKIDPIYLVHEEDGSPAVDGDVKCLNEALFTLSNVHVLDAPTVHVYNAVAEVGGKCIDQQCLAYSY